MPRIRGDNPIDTAGRVCEAPRPTDRANGHPAGRTLRGLASATTTGQGPARSSLSPHSDGASRPNPASPFNRAPGSRDTRPSSVTPTSRRALLARIALLLPEDRTLAQLALDGALTRGQLGRQMNLSPGQVSRRLQRLGARLHDPIVLALCDRSCPLPAEHRQLGIEHFLQGLSVRELAEKHLLGEREVARMIEHVRGWHTATRGWQAVMRRGGR